ncbi:MAG: hypothetical protein AAF211_18130, partial [Myxococcota bacterium]
MFAAILSLLGSTVFASPVGSIDLGSADVAMSGGIYGTGLGDQFGHAMATGDLNGDGHPDLVASAVGMDMVHIFFGPIVGHPTVANADATYQGTFGGEAGWAIAVGDLTDDGQDDLVVSEPSNLSGAGEIYVVAGPLMGGGTYYDSTHPAVVYAFEGKAGPRPWFAAWDMAVGDFDEDGKQDLALGVCEPRYEGPMGVDPINRGVGLVALISQTDMTIGARHALFTDSTSLIWGLGFTGCSIDNAGDTNGDGIEDLVVGSWRVSRSVPGMPNIQSIGAASVIEGRESWDPIIEMATYFEPDLAVRTLPGIYHVLGPDLQGFNLGRSVSPAGDVNGDGYDDILVGAPALDREPGTLTPGSTPSHAYLVYGASDANGLRGRSLVEDVYGARFDATHAT